MTDSLRLMVSAARVPQSPRRRCGATALLAWLVVMMVEAVVPSVSFALPLAERADWLSSLPRSISIGSVNDTGVAALPRFAVVGVGPSVRSFSLEHRVGQSGVRLGRVGLEAALEARGLGGAVVERAVIGFESGPHRSTFDLVGSVIALHPGATRPQASAHDVPFATGIDLASSPIVIDLPLRSVARLIANLTGGAAPFDLELPVDLHATVFPAKQPPRFLFTVDAAIEPIQTVAAVPEPGAGRLIALGLTGLALVRGGSARRR